MQRRRSSVGSRSVDFVPVLSSRSERNQASGRKLAKYKCCGMPIPGDEILGWIKPIPITSAADGQHAEPGNTRSYSMNELSEWRPAVTVRHGAAIAGHSISETTLCGRQKSTAEISRRQTPGGVPVFARDKKD